MTFYRVSLEHDALEDLDFRAQESGGIGYRFLQTPRTVLQGQIGFGLSQERFEGGNTVVTPFGSLGGRWRQTIGRGTELDASFAFLPDLIDLGECRVEVDATLSTALTARFLLPFSLIDQFDSNPQPGVEQNDLTLLSSIVWSF